MGMSAMGYEKHHVRHKQGSHKDCEEKSEDCVEERLHLHTLQERKEKENEKKVKYKIHKERRTKKMKELQK